MYNIKRFKKIKAELEIAQGENIMKKINIEYLCLTLGILSLFLSFFNGIRALSLPIGIIGTILPLIFIIKKSRKYQKIILIISMIISLGSIIIAYGLTYMNSSPDYTSVSVFKKDLDDDKNVVGKTFEFKVTDRTETSINADDEIGFFTSKTDAEGIKKGDIVTIKVKSKPTNILGVYIMSGNVQSKKSNIKQHSKSNNEPSNSNTKKIYNLHNTTFSTPSNWVKQLTNSNNPDNTINFTLQDGYLNVHYFDTNESIFNDDYRNSFLSSLKNTTSNNMSDFTATHETEGSSSESYAWYISLKQNEEKYNGEMVVLDVDGGIISFTIYVSGDKFSKSYEGDFNNLLDSIKYTKRTN